MTITTNRVARGKKTSPKPGPVRPPASTLQIALETVDAATAAQWMDRNVSNRTIRTRRVLEFQRDMLSGKWREVGDPLRFDTNDDLVDGQHRMLALIEAAKEQPHISFEFLIVRGVDPHDRVVIDTGTRRTAGDQLKMAGYGNYSLLASAAKWCSLWDRQAVYADATLKSVTHQEIIKYVEDNAALISICEAVAGHMRNHIDMPSGYVAAGYFLCARVDDSAAFEFFERLTDGAMLAGGDPILALRSRLRELNRDRASLPGDAWLSLLFRTWNARREGRSMRVIPLDRLGKPIPAPEPI